jgi:hypothetical protein
VPLTVLELPNAPHFFQGAQAQLVINNIRLGKGDRDGMGIVIELGKQLLHGLLSPGGGRHRHQRRYYSSTEAKSMDSISHVLKNPVILFAITSAGDSI